MQTWEDLINFHGITDQDVKEIVVWRDETYWTLSDPVHTPHSDAARQAIIKLYTYESPLYKTLNQATLYQDESLVDTLGPFAYLLAESV